MDKQSLYFMNLVLQMYNDGEVTTNEYVESEVIESLEVALSEVWNNWYQIIDYVGAQRDAAPSEALKDNITKALMPDRPLFVRFEVKKGIPVETLNKLNLLRFGTEQEITDGIENPLDVINQTQFKGKSLKVSTFVERRKNFGDWDYVYPVFIGEYD